MINKIRAKYAVDPVAQPKMKFKTYWNFISLTTVQRRENIKQKKKKKRRIQFGKATANKFVTSA